MNTTTSNQWLTNTAAVCVIIFSLSGSAMFIAALIYMQKPAVASKVLLPTPQAIIKSEPILPMLGDPMLANPMLDDPMVDNTLRPQRMPDVHEKFDRANIMASYKAMHSIYN
jgi:hypothetical protein